jgi:cell fate regulator YaaT (PSP1 superfamily)
VQFKTSQEVKVGSYVCIGDDKGVNYVKVVAKREAIGSEASQLSEIFRVADQNDEKILSAFREKTENAFKQCVAMVKKKKVDMKLLDVEYDSMHNKFFFYFKAEGRIDFRQLARNFAYTLKAKIEFRQVWVRDQARSVGGFGLCGRELCCRSFLNNFDSAARKRLGEQVASIPAKVPGACGRIMCCFKFEPPDLNLAEYAREKRKEMPEAEESYGYD